MHYSCPLIVDLWPSVNQQFENWVLRVQFFKKIQNWIPKSERIQKRILPFFTKQINPRSLGSWCVKGTKESTSDSFIVSDSTFQLIFSTVFVTWVRDSTLICPMFIHIGKAFHGLYKIRQIGKFLSLESTKTRLSVWRHISTMHLSSLWRSQVPDRSS